LIFIAVFDNGEFLDSALCVNALSIIYLSFHIWKLINIIDKIKFSNLFVSLKFAKFAVVFFYTNFNIIKPYHPTDRHGFQVLFV